jgi:DNA processing protein
VARRVLDACPVRIGVAPERLAAIAGCDVLDVLKVLPALELADLVQWTGAGWRLTPPPKEVSGQGVRTM